MEHTNTVSINKTHENDLLTVFELNMFGEQCSAVLFKASGHIDITFENDRDKKLKFTKHSHGGLMHLVRNCVYLFNDLEQ